MNLLCNHLSYLLRFGTAMEAHVIEGGVIEAKLVFLHLGLNAADSSFRTTLAPTSILSPLCAGPLQCWVAAAAELDVVHGCVIPKETLVGLHTNLERGEHACGAEHDVGPLPEAGQERRKYERGGIVWKRCWLRSMEGHQDMSTSERLICNPGRSGAFKSPLNVMGSCQSAASCCSLCCSAFVLAF